MSLPKTWMPLRSGLCQYASATLRKCISVLYLVYVCPVPMRTAIWYFCSRSCWPLNEAEWSRSVERAIWLTHSFSNSCSIRHDWRDISSHE